MLAVCEKTGRAKANSDAQSQYLILKFVHIFKGMHDHSTLTANDVCASHSKGWRLKRLNLAHKFSDNVAVGTVVEGQVPTLEGF